MYVVRRSFRNFGEVLTPGTVVQPGDIKRFKTKLNERVIIAVSENDFDAWNAYFEKKLGVSIKVPETSSEDQSEEKPEVKPDEKPDGQPEEKPAATVVVAAVAK